MAAEPAPTVRRSGRRSVRRSGRRGAVAIVLVVLGLLLWLAYRLTVSGEAHSYAAGATPPSTFALTSGGSYSIGVPGGERTVLRRLNYTAPLSCSITPVGGVRTSLAVSAEGSSSRALNQIATFVSPTTGRAAINCAGLPAVFVDDSDDADVDYAGLWLVLASIALAVGLPLLLSALRAGRRPR